MKRLISIICVVVMFAMPIATVVQAQNELFSSAVVFWDVADQEYSYFMSSFFWEEEFARKEQIDTNWEIVESLEGGLVDYLAVFGLAGYELVGSFPRGAEIIFIFQKSNLGNG